MICETVPQYDMQRFMSLIERQEKQIEQQSVLIKKLAADCEAMGKNSIKIAKATADKEIRKFKHAYVQDVKELKARVAELDKQNQNLKVLAGTVTAIALVCVGVAATPYVLVVL